MQHAQPVIHTDIQKSWIATCLLVLFFQQVLLSISSTISIPLIVAKEICAGDLDLVKSEIMSTFIFMSGVCTLMQTTLGVR